MTPHLPVSSHPAHHLLDALPPSSHHRRLRRRRRFCPPRPRASSSSSSLRCRAAAAAAPQPAAAAAAEARTRVFVVSDLHTDYPENMEWVRRLAVRAGAPGAGGGFDALVVAGDVAETRDNFARTMEALRERFDAVFYVPGNHDLWLRREGGRYVSGFRLPPPAPRPFFLCLTICIPCAASMVFDEMRWPGASAGLFLVCPP